LVMRSADNHRTQPIGASNQSTTTNRHQHEEHPGKPAAASGTG
jgi:hypothetical protein